jgi:hypothetical protein
VAQALRFFLAAGALWLILIQPNHPGALTWGALRLFPLELPVILAALVGLPGRARLFRAVLVAALIAIALLKAVDFAMFLAFNRGFNPVTDWGLIGAGWNLGSGTLGAPMAALAVLAAGALAAGIAVLLWWATDIWAALSPPPGLRRGALALAAVSGAYAVAEIGHAGAVWRLPFDPPGAAFTARLGWERASLVRRTRDELSAFRAAAATDSEAGRPGQLARLGGRDVLVVFVESYGRASFDNPRYAPTHLATLREGERTLADAGLAIRSGWLASPIEGGQSWLAHATLASGLRVDDQIRYAALLASPRQTLWQIAAGAGYRTAAVMPQITVAWPEGTRLGFGTRLAAADMGYAGPAFNWVTMPDQFTLAALPRLLPASEKPLFATVVLVSSHAPWVPVPEMIPWNEVGDGAVFARFTEDAPAPVEVWADDDLVRDQYRLAIDYSLRVLFDWAARQGPEGPLLIVLGDHPAVGFVSGVGSPDVPVHLIGPAEALAPFAGWGWTAGAVPAADLPDWPMEAFRDRFLAALRVP